MFPFRPIFYGSSESFPKSVSRKPSLINSELKITNNENETLAKTRSSSQVNQALPLRHLYDATIPEKPRA